MGIIYALWISLYSFAQGPVPAAPAPVVTGTTCTDAHPIAWGQQPKLSKNWVVYTRQDLMPNVFPPPQPTRGIGAYSLASQQEVYPLLPNPGLVYQDMQPKIAGDHVFFIRFGRWGWQLHLMDLRNPQSAVILDQGGLVWGVAPTVQEAFAGAQIDAVDENDFILSWSVYVGTPGHLRDQRWCHISQCLQGQWQSSFFPPGQNLPGDRPGETINLFEGHSFYAPPGQGDFFYQFWNTAGQLEYAYYSLGAVTSLAGPMPSGTSFRNANIFGPMMSYTLSGPGKSEGKIGVLSQGLPTIYRTSPGATESDEHLVISPRTSTLGSGLLASWYRIGGPQPGLYADYALGPSGSSGPTVVSIASLAAAGWTECTLPSVYENTIVMVCSNPYLSQFPLVARSDCHP